MSPDHRTDHLIAMDLGLKYAIREGGKTVGAGTVSTIIEYYHIPLRSDHRDVV